MLATGSRATHMKRAVHNERIVLRV